MQTVVSCLRLHVSAELRLIWDRKVYGAPMKQACSSRANYRVMARRSACEVMTDEAEEEQVVVVVLLLLLLLLVPLRSRPALAVPGAVAASGKMMEKYK